MNFIQEINQTTFMRLLILGLIMLMIYHIFIKSSNRLKQFQSNNSKLNNTQQYANQWINTGFGYGYGDMNPSDKIIDLVHEFGPPDVFNSEKGGGAIWYHQSLKGTPYQRIEIHDEQIPHDKPNKHTDFLYSWYKIDIPEHKIPGLSKISKSIDYDSKKQLMIARCYDIKPIVVTHWIVKNYAEGNLNLDEAVGMYGPMIIEIMNDSENTKTER